MRGRANSRIFFEGVAILLPTTIFMMFVISNIPFPFIDEHYHYDQIESYYKQNWGYWNPGLTTFPGMHIYVATLSYGLERVFNITFTLTTCRCINAITSILLNTVSVNEIINITCPSASRNQKTVVFLSIILFPFHWFYYPFLY
eukprot:Filipodium_phascolosomae@DN6490_c0_g1_i1.p1